MRWFRMVAAWCGAGVLSLLAGALPASAQSPLAAHPVILIPGWGPAALTSYVHFLALLEADGVPLNQVHTLTYDYLGTLRHIEAQLTEQIGAVMGQYDAGTRFIFVGHSTGQFVGLASIMHNGWDDRVAKFIALAGIGHGWDCPACNVGLLGPSQTKLSPFMSPYLERFWGTYGPRIDALETCSVFSPEDGLIHPYDSGRLPTGVAVEVPGIPHLEEIKSSVVYEAVKARCF